MKVKRPDKPVRKKIPVTQDHPTTHAPIPPSTFTPVTFKLQKLLAQKGLGSRREMEALIAAGEVSVNGKIAVVGDRVGAEDVVRIGKRVIRLNLEESLPKVLLYHKPEGEIVSQHDPEGRPSVFDKLPHIHVPLQNGDALTDWPIHHRL